MTNKKPGRQRWGPRMVPTARKGLARELFRPTTNLLLNVNSHRLAQETFEFARTLDPRGVLNVDEMAPQAANMYPSPEQTRCWCPLHSPTRTDTAGKSGPMTRCTFRSGQVVQRESTQAAQAARAHAAPNLPVGTPTAAPPISAGTATLSAALMNPVACSQRLHS